MSREKWLSDFLEILRSLPRELGRAIPKPPNLTGNAKVSIKFSPGIEQPVSAGRSLVCIILVLMA